MKTSPPGVRIATKTLANVGPCAYVVATPVTTVVERTVVSEFRDQQTPDGFVFVSAPPALPLNSYSHWLKTVN